MLDTRSISSLNFFHANLSSTVKHIRLLFCHSLFLRVRTYSISFFILDLVSVFKKKIGSKNDIQILAVNIYVAGQMRDAELQRWQHNFFVFFTATKYGFVNSKERLKIDKMNHWEIIEQIFALNLQTLITESHSSLCWTNLSYTEAFPQRGKKKNIHNFKRTSLGLTWCPFFFFRFVGSFNNCNVCSCPDVERPCLDNNSAVDLKKNYLYLFALPFVCVCVCVFSFFLHVCIYFDWAASYVFVITRTLTSIGTCFISNKSLRCC